MAFVPSTDCQFVAQKKFKLLPLTKYTYKQYGMYGWQVASDNEMINEQGRKLSQFLDIYENSF